MSTESPGDQTKCIGSVDFGVPNDARYFEDYIVGSTYEYGYAHITEEAIVSFALEFDPQPFHVNREQALNGPFKGLVASGFHTNAIFMRMFADHYLSKVASLGSPGIDEIRWTVPVRPGDSLRLRTTIVESRPSVSKPDRGLLRTKAELLNQEHDVVMSLIMINLLSRRPSIG